MHCRKPFCVEYWHVFQLSCQKQNLPSQFMNVGVTASFVPHFGHTQTIQSLDVFWISAFKPEMKHFTNLHQYLDVKKNTQLVEKNLKTQRKMITINSPTLVAHCWAVDELKSVLPAALVAETSDCWPALSAASLSQLNPTMKHKNHTAWMWYHDGHENFSFPPFWWYYNAQILNKSCFLQKNKRSSQINA